MITTVNGTLVITQVLQRGVGDKQTALALVDHIKARMGGNDNYVIVIGWVE
jgi:hypothetical protein